MIVVKCNVCGKELTRFPSHVHARNYCSDECMYSDFRRNKNGHIIRDGIVVVKLLDDREVYMDLVDLDLTKKSIYLLSNKYPGCMVNGCHKYLHRVILERILDRELQSGEIVDHVNGNPLDNRRLNLRLADYSTNARNGSSHSDSIYSGYKGVCFDKSRNKWVANKYVS